MILESNLDGYTEPPPGVPEVEFVHQRYGVTHIVEVSAAARIAELEAQLVAAIAERDRLREALKFYANEEHYGPGPAGVLADIGAIARKALEDE